jgi:hypothetical protein
MFHLRFELKKESEARREHPNTTARSRSPGAPAAGQE